MTDYDGYWYLGDTRFEEACSTWSALFFWVGALGILWRRVPGTLALVLHIYVAVMLANLGIVAFFVHSLGSRKLYDDPGRPPVWVYLDRAAQCWMLAQATAWSLCGLRLPYRWYWVAPAMAYTYPWIQWHRPDGDIILFLTLFGILIGGAIQQEYFRVDSCRHRTMYLTGLGAILGLLLTMYVYDRDLSNPLGQFGHLWIHLLQTMLIIQWFYFWIQQEHPFFEIGLPDALRCCPTAVEAVAMTV